MGNEHFRVPLFCNIFQFYLDKSDENIFDLKCLFMLVPVLYADAELLYSFIDCRHQPRQPPCLYPDTRNTHYSICFFFNSLHAIAEPHHLFHHQVYICGKKRIPMPTNLYEGQNNGRLPAAHALGL